MSPFVSIYGCVLVTTSAACQTPGGAGARGTDSWLDDTDKNFGPDLPLLLRMHEIWSVNAQGNYYNIVDTRCQVLRLKCTKFNFGWGPAPDPTGEITALPRPTSCI